MSLVADIYVSRDDEAARYDTNPTEFADRAEFSSFTSLELSTLWAILRQTEWTVEMMSAFSSVLVVDDGERLIERFPAELVSALADLPADRLVSVTKQWAETEEINCSPEDIQPVVQGLTRLAGIARGSGQNLYIWNSV